ncbi:LacI family DNA-binding transcriptional regulator [Microbacterium sp. LWH7-1.2]|uniref:LacI family DNA-binding transcriptional regulator n=1 Tax=Microbacterium sp. LWH7-1.2 TaxID=3135257 RepID=UPI003139F87F
MMVTIRDVAERASVAPMTVSRVINQPDSVSPATRARVEAVIAELRYVPNMLGQSLRTNRTMVIALVVSDINNPFAIQQIRSVGEAARERGYTVVFTHTEASEKNELDQLRTLIEHRVDGVVLSPVTNRPDSVDFVMGQNVPISVIGYPMPYNDVDVVRSDSRTAAEELTRYLIGLGHERLAMLSGPREIVTARERTQGFAAALAAAELEPVSLHHAPYTADGGYRMMQAVLQADTRPTAVVTANNLIAVGAARASRDLGVKVPNELSIVTFDDAPSDAVLDPYFTGILQPTAEMAETATRLLLERVSGDYSGEGREIVLPTRLEVHASTAPPADAGKRGDRTS